VLRTWAQFVDARTVEAGDIRIRARRFVLATGSSPFIPPIAGLDQVPYLTNETIFARIAEIRDLIVLGGGPVGVELAQGFARLGARVQLVEMARLLPRDDGDAVDLVRTSLQRDGVSLLEGSAATEVRRAGDRIRLAVGAAAGETHWVDGAHLLVAVGRRPRVDDMGLDRAGIAATAKGIQVDAGLRTTNRRVYAIGDCTGGPAFTHAAGHQAGLVIRSALFRLPVRFDAPALPWVTYSDPELAQVGLTEQAARQAGADIVVTHQPFAGNDRARAERHDDGFLKIISDRRGRVLGVTIVGVQAGELLAPWCLAMARNMKLSALAGTILPYPTLSELGKHAAGAFYAPRLFSPPIRRLVRILRWFG
jgi:pyruvate/2-oxoglutarate dehydrogenase complex dihydrolipoamide dehydrogenase (E3) component